MKSLSLLIKPCSSNCNIDCKYCFYKNEDSLRKEGCLGYMTLETLEILVKRAFECASERISFVFQGGEPTIIGIDFYEKFIEFVNKYNVNRVNLDFSIQTNGILINEKWCRFLKKNNFLVGLSFDGCPKINNFNRVDYKGLGTSNNVVNAIKLFQKFGVEYNVLIVLTKQMVGYEKECYEYLKKNKVQYIQLIPVLDPYGEKKCSRDFSLCKEDLKICLSNYFDLWYEDFLKNEEVRVTYFENIITKILGGQTTMCSMNGQCMIETVVEADGGVYPCDFYVSDEWKLGDIKEKDFKSIVFSLKAMEFISKSHEINERCNSCGCKGMCLGSCRRYQLNSMTSYENYFCESYREFFTYIGPRVLAIATEYSKRS